MQAKMITSELFENLQYRVYPNGYSRELLTETPDLDIDRAYSPVELFGDNKLAIIGTMYEGSRLNDKACDSLYHAYLGDCYNLDGLKTNIENLNYLAFYRKGTKTFDIVLQDQKSLRVRLDSKKDVNKMMGMCSNRFGLIVYSIDEMTCFKDQS